MRRDTAGTFETEIELKSSQIYVRGDTAGRFETVIELKFSKIYVRGRGSVGAGMLGYEYQQDPSKNPSEIPASQQNPSKYRFF